MKLALDTNILAYAEGVNGAERHEQAMALIARIPNDAGVIPAQALGELFNVLVRKAGRTRASARDSLLAWRDAFPAVETSADIVMLAADLAADHKLGIWDSVILATASQAGCRLLLSEDMQDGFTWGGVTVTNPFSSTRSPMLEALLGD
ncbi:PIN domain-containing protein [Sphingomonas abietis]|uniref:PIN domain-containing protein n=1 Tax=Sphingomonas abietis TaxID=3012344 RepID=A0ABY7NS13_9SPHN|nr:PIN domain-containing protein [Sphingomonas abietis]WBO24341.1 PIN domain-containing protein [Sphingomonas abietis]